MSSQVKNGAEGYLTDVLDVIQNLLNLKKYYDTLMATSDEADDDLADKRRLYDKKHAFVISALYAAVCVLIQTVLVVINIRTLYIAPILLLSIPTLATFITMRIYKTKILITYEKVYKACKEELDNKITEAKRDIKTQYVLYESLVDKLKPECRHSLAVYIMKCAAKDGLVLNVFKAQDYYKNREEFFKNNNSDHTVAARINDSIHENDILNTFLEHIH